MIGQHLRNLFARKVGPPWQQVVSEMSGHETGHDVIKANQQANPCRKKVHIAAWTPEGNLQHERERQID
jgi:hypothetical protein